MSNDDDDDYGVAYTQCLFEKMNRENRFIASINLIELTGCDINEHEYIVIFAICFKWNTKIDFQKFVSRQK